MTASIAVCVELAPDASWQEAAAVLHEFVHRPYGGCVVTTFCGQRLRVNPGEAFLDLRSKLREIQEGALAPDVARVGAEIKARLDEEHARSRCAKPGGALPGGKCIDRQGHTGVCTVGYRCGMHGYPCTLELNVCTYVGHVESLCGELGPWSAVSGGRGCDKPKGHDGLHRLTVTSTGWEVRT